jgi:hypothetical protein
VQNLVTHCAEVQKGENVLILNEYGKIDDEIAELIVEAVKATGADYHVMWGESLERGRRDLPKVLLGGILSADKVICNYAINRAVLDEHTRGKGIIQINNGCRTAQMMTTPHATFHWGMVRAIYGRLEEVFGDGERWRITSPAGTDVSGRIGKGSDVADAYFAAEAEASRFIRVFPGEVYTPVGSVAAEGTIVCEYINIRDTEPWAQPATLTVKDSRVVKIEGGAEAKRFEAEVEENTRKHGDNATVIDSWHGGMNPKARVPAAENRSLQGATSGAGMMHFHVGRILEPVSAGVLNHTVELDGRKIYEAGKLLILDDPKIQETARRYGVEDL